MGASNGARRARRAFGIPPSSGQAAQSGEVLIGSADLPDLAGAARLVLIIGPEDLDREADRINDALGDFALWDEAEQRDAGNAAKAQWCAQVAERAGELHRGLGMRSPIAASDGQPFRDAMQHLSRGAPLHDPLLASALRRAEPEKRSRNMQEGREVSDTTLFWDAMERMAYSLWALQRVAHAATRGWTAEIKHGGSKVDGARLALFRKLGGSFTDLFGRKPTISTRTVKTGNRQTLPTGPCMDWHAALLKLVAERVRAPVWRPTTQDASAPAERSLGMRRLAELGDWANGLRQERQTDSRDGLAEAIREAEASKKRRPD